MHWKRSQTSFIYRQYNHQCEKLQVIYKQTNKNNIWVETVSGYYFNIQISVIFYVLSKTIIILNIAFILALKIRIQVFAEVILSCEQLQGHR